MFSGCRKCGMTTDTGFPGLGEPLATFNVKHYGVIAALTTVQPY